MRFGCRHLSLILVFCLASQIANTQAPELIAFWDVSDESSTTEIDHSVWQDILDDYLKSHESKINRFDYGGLKANDADFQILKRYLVELSRIDPRTISKSEQLPYWINFYNALTVFVVTGRYPIESIKDIKSGMFNFGPWDIELVTVADQRLTLNNIEHGILRPIWNDPRLHYAVNCASLGCPNLSEEVYRSDNAERLLELSSKIYINHWRGVSIKDDQLLISSIYDWFKVDFGGTDEAVIAHLLKYSEPELAQKIQIYHEFDDHYDWKLNDPDADNFQIDRNDD